MIVARGLRYTHPGTPAGAGPALDGAEFSVPPGALLCLCGVNGSGKTTLLQLLAGLLRAEGGTLDVAGHQCPGAEAALRRHAALVLQDADMQMLGATVAEDLLLVAPPAHTPQGAVALAAARAAAGRFGLAAHWDSPVHTLSYGQKRKLCLAAALLAAPGLLLLDEPFSGLDHPAALELRDILSRNRSAGLTQVVSVHELEPVVDMADLMLVLDGGRQVLFGPPAAVLDRVRAHGIRPPCSWTARREIVPYE
ncbi:ATP-binding cassette domain-containing protein [Nitratidesulfovibrio termitidis]|uniref:ATP-binding cassette domain-containing protein n=1 Tax=Nitratidesulfovibrio termitidis TaxID=42252 RepID=UPI00041B937C|nr:ATP-binding cassette domain-containing protein [Nitratidesulfovibrio termitidis]